MAWDDVKKAKAVELYLEKEPTPENSMEIVKQVAEEIGESPNGVRLILTNAGVYVKKTAAASSPTTGGTATKTTRVSKADAQKALEDAIVAAGCEVDSEITSKLTGKAANYLAEIISKIGN